MNTFLSQQNTHEVGSFNIYSVTFFVGSKTFFPFHSDLEGKGKKPSITAMFFN